MAGTHQAEPDVACWLSGADGVSCSACAGGAFACTELWCPCSGQASPSRHSAAPKCSTAAQRAPQTRAAQEFSALSFSRSGHKHQQLKQQMRPFSQQTASNCAAGGFVALLGVRLGQSEVEPRSSDTRLWQKAAARTARHQVAQRRQAATLRASQRRRAHSYAAHLCAGTKRVSILLCTIRNSHTLVHSAGAAATQDILCTGWASRLTASGRRSSRHRIRASRACRSQNKRSGALASTGAPAARAYGSLRRLGTPGSAPARLRASRWS